MAVCEALHAAGPPNVVITSIDKPSSIALVGASAAPSDSSAGGGDGAFCIEVAKREQYFGGTGDLLAGLLLAHGTEHPQDLGRAASLAVGCVQGVIARTVEMSQASGGGQSSGLQLVASRDVILNPPPAELVAL